LVAFGLEVTPVKEVRPDSPYSLQKAVEKKPVYPGTARLGKIKTKKRSLKLPI